MAACRLCRRIPDCRNLMISFTKRDVGAVGLVSGNRTVDTTAPSTRTCRVAAPGAMPLRWTLGLLLIVGLIGSNTGPAAELAPPQSWSRQLGWLPDARFSAVQPAKLPLPAQQALKMELLPVECSCFAPSTAAASECRTPGPQKLHQPPDIALRQRQSRYPGSPCSGYWHGVPGCSSRPGKRLRRCKNSMPGSLRQSNSCYFTWAKKSQGVFPLGDVWQKYWFCSMSLLLAWAAWSKIAVFSVS